MVSNFLANLTAQLYSSVSFWTILVICLTLLWNWWKRPNGFPPGPRGIPILGVLPFLDKHPERSFKRWSLETYGPVMAVRMGRSDVVVLNTFETINQALVRQGNVFSGRPTIELYTQVLGDEDGVLFSKYTERFKIQKKFGVQALKQFGMGKREMENIINEEVRYFVEFLKAKVGKPVYLGLDFHNMIGNVICKIAFGRRFDYEDPHFKNIFQILKETYSDPRDASRIAILLFFFKLARNIPPFSTVNERVIKSELDMAEGFRLLIDEHREHFDKNCIRDFIDAYLYEQKYGSDRSTFTDRNLEVYVRDMFTAGTETASSTMGWNILCLMHFPDFHKLMVEEIDNAFGSSEKPSLLRKSEIPLTCAFNQEVFRYCPVVPNSVQHLTQGNAELYGFKIPSGTPVTPNVWGAHFDPETWPDPHKFDPYRHINKEGKFIPSMKIIPFGIGPRYCLGESIGRAETLLTFVGLLQKFTISAADPELPSLKDGMTSIVCSPPKHYVILKIR